MSISSSGPRSCTVRLDQVSTQDRGSYMCLLNQADVFHTDRRWGQSAVNQVIINNHDLSRYVSLDVATAASLRLGRMVEQEAAGGGAGELQEARVLDLVAGQEVELGCEARWVGDNDNNMS